MRPRLGFAVALGFLLAGVPLKGASSTILAVFAHPDDETSVGPLLARYADEGHAVYLALVTSGQIGDSHTDIPRGERLGAVREEEARCASLALGIRPPLLLGFMDGAVSDRQTLPKVRERLRQVIDEIKPEVVITWGPDGLTGHPDHRAVSSVVTELFQQRSGASHAPRKLYYVAYPESRFQNLPESAAQVAGQLGLVADQWITTRIDGSGFLELAHRAIRCHKTQWPPEMMETMRELSATLLEGTVYLRLALADGTAPRLEEDLFE